MKKLVLLFFAVLYLSDSYAQFVVKSEVEVNQVPTKVNLTFQQKFSEAKIYNWYKVGATTYEVYIKNGKSKELVIFDWEGRVGEELIEVKLKEVPKEEILKINNKYKNLKIKRAFKSKQSGKYVIEGDNEGKIYQIQL